MANICKTKRFAYLFPITKFHVSFDDWTNIHHGVYVVLALCVSTNCSPSSPLFLRSEQVPPNGYTKWIYLQCACTWMKIPSDFGTHRCDLSNWNDAKCVRKSHFHSSIKQNNYNRFRRAPRLRRIQVREVSPLRIIYVIRIRLKKLPEREIRWAYPIWHSARPFALNLLLFRRVCRFYSTRCSVLFTIAITFFNWSARYCFVSPQRIPLLSLAPSARYCRFPSDLPVAYATRTMLRVSIEFNSMREFFFRNICELKLES